MNGAVTPREQGVEFRVQPGKGLSLGPLEGELARGGGLSLAV